MDVFIKHSIIELVSSYKRVRFLRKSEFEIHLLDLQVDPTCGVHVHVPAVVHWRAVGDGGPCALDQASQVLCHAGAVARVGRRPLSGST